MVILSADLKCLELSYSIMYYIPLAKPRLEISFSNTLKQFQYRLYFNRKNHISFEKEIYINYPFSKGYLLDQLVNEAGLSLYIVEGVLSKFSESDFLVYPEVVPF